MTPQELEALPKGVEALYSGVEQRIMSDVVRRIKKMGEITSTADHQLLRLLEMGHSTEYVEATLKEALNASWAEMFELYDKVINWEYVRKSDLYEQVNAKYIPYAQNETLQSWTQAAIEQSAGSLKNLSNSTGFSVLYAGQRLFMPFSQYWQSYVDPAIADVLTGVQSAQTVIRKVVSQMTESGLRTVDYARGKSTRVDVAARRAVMTGVNQLSAKINEQVGKELGTDWYEITYHVGARPTHWWGGEVFEYKDLVQQCGLGEVQGLCGANCRHNYMPFIPGVSTRTHTPEQLEKLRAEEKETKIFGTKEYTTYEATQQQRALERQMRAQREKIDLLKQGGADPEDITVAEAKYRTQLYQYRKFSEAMGIQPQIERVYYDMRGRVIPYTPKYVFQVAKTVKSDTVEARQMSYSDVSTKKEAVEYLKTKLGLSTSSANRLSLDVQNELNRALTNIYNDYPQAKNIVQRVSAKALQSDVVAKFTCGINKNNGSLVTEIVINENIGSLQDIVDMVKKQVATGYWTEKAGLEGILRHEMGHAIELQLTFLEKGIDPFATDVNGYLMRSITLNERKNNKLANEVITSIFKTNGLDITYDNLESNISRYAADDYKDTGRLGEAFAELISDNSHRKITVNFKNEIGGKYANTSTGGTP